MGNGNFGWLVGGLLFSRFKVTVGSLFVQIKKEGNAELTSLLF